MATWFTKASMVGGLATIAALMTAPAQAGLVMKYAVNGGGFTTVADGDAEDTIGATGTINILLAGFGNITIGMLTGNNFDYQPGDPIQLHLNTFGNVSNGAGVDSLEVWVTSTDYLQSAGTHTIKSDLGVSANPGEVTWNAYLDAANAEFGTGLELASKTTTQQGGSAGATEVDDVTLTDDPFSLSQRFLITWGSGTAGAINLVGTVEFAVPEPATLALFGIGLLGLGIVRRRKA